MAEDAGSVLGRLSDAMNGRDLAAFVACFDPGYESQQPAHPDRNFRGRDHVQRNWSTMFTSLPDFRAETIACSIERDSFWVEWRWTGTRPDQTPLDARGTCIFGVRDGLIIWGRLYMEDVSPGKGIDAAVESLSGRRP